MADYDNRVIRGQSSSGALAIDEGLRAYMLRVYNYMVVGLVLTGLAAYGTFVAAVTADPSQAAARLPNGILLTNFGVTLFTSPLRWVLILGVLGLVMFISYRLNRMSLAAAQMSFWAFAALNGVMISSIFVVYTYASIGQVFLVTAATFGTMSLYGYTTQRDLTSWGSFLFMGLIGVIIAMLVNYFLASSMLAFVISIIGVIVFTGLTAYDTQKIKAIYVAGDDGTVMGRKAIYGALNLYLDFINLFLMILRLMGTQRR